METKNENCKGCLLGEACAAMRSLKYKEECPCGKCLIKMICKDACETYREFRRGFLS